MNFSFDDEMEFENVLELIDEFEDEVGDSKDQSFEFIPPKDSRRQVRRRDLKKPPYRYICLIYSEILGKIFQGTGTLIGPRTVLTAGHNIKPQGKTPSKVTVIPAARGFDTPPFGKATAIDLKLPYNFEKATQFDYGIIILDRDIGNTAGYWGFDHKRWSWDSRGTSIIQTSLPFLPGGFKVNIAGYPNDLPKDKPGAKKCESRSSITRLMYRVFDTTVRRFKSKPPSDPSDPTPPTGLLEYKNDTCRGMSGSPVWIKRSRFKGGRVMVAIHIRRDIPTTPGLANAGVLIDRDVRKFILKHKK